MTSIMSRGPLTPSSRRGFAAGVISATRIAVLFPICSIRSCDITPGWAGGWRSTDAQAGPRNRLLAWLALDGKTPDQVASLFNGTTFAPAVLTEPESRLLVKLQGCSIDHPAMPDEVRGECTDWAIASLRRRFDGSFQREMAALLTAVPLDLRVNPLKSTREAVLRALRDLGLRAEASRMAPYGIRVRERPSLAGLPMLRNGEVEIQDEGSQLVAALVDARAHRLSASRLFVIDARAP